MKTKHRLPFKRARPISDEEWIRRHFEELVDRYPGQYAVVAGGRRSSGLTPFP